jgi:uncharacterized protein (TIGR02421 family)
VEFQSSGFQTEPLFHYRPLTEDTVALKRALFKIPVERIENPALSELFRDKVIELDRQVGLLNDIGSKRFMPGSLQLFGGVDPNLYVLATDLLVHLPPSDEGKEREHLLDAKRFARLARQELRYYQAQLPELTARVELRDDTHSGLMVSSGNLLVGQKSRVPAARAQALLQHEIGTHILTYFNGLAQPLQQLASGLAGYDPLQEGIAVFSEYLVGGLSSGRLRLLALRVIATRHMLDGASFSETFRVLYRDHQLDPRAAFTVAMRIFRGGGLTKDALYLAGLVRLLRYLARGGELEPLLVGKIAAEHVPLIRELFRRGLLRPPPLRPRYFELPAARARLELARKGLAVHDLVGLPESA